MADVILSQGRSSRLYQSLVYQQVVAQSVNSNADLKEDAGLFYLTAILAAGLIWTIVHYASGPSNKEASALLDIASGTIRW